MEMGFTGILAIAYAVLLIADGVALAKRMWLPAIALTAVMAVGLVALWMLWVNSSM